MTNSFTLPDASATQKLGAALATVLRAGDLVILTGDLGAGKTTLTQGLGEALGVSGRVSSPTFIIARVHHNRGEGPDLVHVDAYRLESLAEVDDLDLDTALEDSITVVEWGAGLVEDLAEDRLEISLVRARGDETALDWETDPGRVAHITAVGPRWAGVNLGELPL